MANRTGVYLSPRDRRILEFLALSRYITADQALGLLGTNDNWPSNIHRRLNRLCRPPRDSGIPYLYRFAVRRENGSPLNVWTTTERGWREAEKLIPYISGSPPAQLGWQAMEHHIALTNLLVRLIVQFSPNPTDSLLDLPFRWFPDSERQIDFKLYEKTSGLLVPTALKPDAILEAAAPKRRLFLELEMGNNSITTDQPFTFNPGAITRKLDRYTAFFTGLIDLEANTTWYSKRFPDAFVPEIVFLVHSEGRKERVASILKKAVASHPATRPFGVRILTFDEASAHFAALFEGRAVPTSRILTVPESVAQEVRGGYDKTVAALNHLVKAINAHNERHPTAKIALPPLPRDAILKLGETIKHDLLGEPRPVVKWAALMGGEHAPAKRAAKVP